MKLRALSFLCVSVCLLAFVLFQSSLVSKGMLNAPSRGLAAGGSRQPSLPAVPEAAQSQVLKAYGKLPLSFEVNRGQADRRVKFLSRGSGYSLFLTPTETVLALHEPGSRNIGHPAEVLSTLTEREAQQTPPTVLRMKLVGANRTPQISGVEQRTGKSNYFIGNDPKKWRTNVPNYTKVRYRNVYAGVDVVYYGNQRQLEHDFIVAPGADPQAILLAFYGAERMQVDAQGDLVLQASEGEVRLLKPVVYQQAGGVRQEIAASYLLKDNNQVGFEVASYDRAKPLIIDPVLVYSTYLGGTGGDLGIGIAVDREGNAYVTGGTNSSDFPGTSTSTIQPSFGGGEDAFVSKLNEDGTALVYSTYLGGTGTDRGFGIAVDREGNAYVTGFTASPNFPGTSTSTIQSTLGGGGVDAFVSKLNEDGSVLVYSTYLGGTGTDQGFGIAVDRQGNAYVTGATNSSNFPGTSTSTIQPTFGGSGDAFVSKLNGDGTALIYSTYLGGSGGDQGNGIAVDREGNAYVTGFTSSTNFPGTSTSTIQPTNGGGGDAFVSKLNEDGSALVYSTYLGGTGNDQGFGIAVDREGSAYVTGFTSSTNFPGTSTSTIQPTFGGGGDAFVSKLNEDGTALVYSTYLGGSGFDLGFGIAVDRKGNAYVTGQTASPNFPTKNALQPSNGGDVDAFVSKLNEDGTALVYSTYLGSSGFDQALGIAVDREGNAYVTGQTTSPNFPTKHPLQPTFAGGGTDAFVSKISSRRRTD